MNLRRCVFVSGIVFKSLSEKTKEAIIKDIKRKDEKDFSLELLYKKLLFMPQYRNIFYYRVQKDTNSKSIFIKILIKILQICCPAVSSIELYVSENLGGTLFASQVLRNKCKKYR